MVRGWLVKPVDPRQPLQSSLLASGKTISGTAAKPPQLSAN
jgi:hypothetical protein